MEKKNPCSRPCGDGAEAQSSTRQTRRAVDPPAGAFPAGWSRGSSTGAVFVHRAGTERPLLPPARKGSAAEEGRCSAEGLLPGDSIQLLPSPLLGRSLGASSGSNPSWREGSCPDSLEREKPPGPGSLRSQLASATKRLSWCRRSRNNAAVHTAASPPPPCPQNYRFVSLGPQHRAQSKAATPLWHRWLSVLAAQALLPEEAEEQLPPTRGSPEGSVRASQDGKSKRFPFSDSAFPSHLKRLLW